MDLPVSFLGWANVLAHSWAFLAFSCAAIAGGRALHAGYRQPGEADPAAPFCLIADATRWLLFRPQSRVRWRPRDFKLLGLFAVIIACAAGAFDAADFLIGFDWRKLGLTQGLARGVSDGVMGSALIILLCGLEMHFKQGGRP